MSAFVLIEVFKFELSEGLGLGELLADGFGGLTTVVAVQALILKK